MGMVHSLVDAHTRTKKVLQACTITVMTIMFHLAVDI